MEGDARPGNPSSGRHAAGSPACLLPDAQLRQRLDPAIQWTASRSGILTCIVVPPGQASAAGARPLAGLRWRDVVAPQDLPLLRPAIQQALGGSLPLDVRCRLRLGGGAPRWHRVRAAPVRDAAGRVRGWLGRSEDVHQQVMAEDELRASEAHHRYTVELNPGLPWTASPEGMVEEVSPRWEEITGQPREAAMGNGWAGRLHPDDIGPTFEAWRAALRSGDPVDIEYRLKGRDGVYRWFRARAQARRDRQGAIVRWYGALEGIDDRKAAEDALRENEQRFRLAVQAAELGVWDYDARTGRRVWSPELRAILGIASGAPADTATAFRLVHPDDRDVLQALLDGTGKPDPQGFEATLRIRRDDDGRERWLKVVGWKTYAASGELLRALATFRDITDERTADERIRWMATHDPLTRLPNRGAFQHELERRIGRGLVQEGMQAVLLIDVDHLKEANERMGHDVGDVLLCALADRLRQVLPEGAFVARLGSDDFGALLRAEDGLDLDALGAAIGAPLRPALGAGGRLLDCRASTGVAFYPEHGRDAAELAKAADTALYAAKAAGRGGMTVFHPDMRRTARRRAQMLERARVAIDAQRVYPHYQPKVRLDTGRIDGFEALLRWHTGDGRMLAPAGIAAAFEDLELAARLHDCMFANILSDLRRWLDAGLDVGRIAVNASAAQFVHDDFAEQFLEGLAAYGIPARYLELEVTETVFLGRGAEGVGRALRVLGGEGVRIALDDFGTGYASLTHLKSFPVHAIKIDKSFMANLDDPAGNAAIVEAVVAMGHKLGMETVAEGVEQADQRDFLQRSRCDIGQGFLFSRAIAPEHVPGLLQSWSRRVALGG